MPADGTSERATDGPATNGNPGQTVPTISLPRGGGAIRGIGEKFAANPVSGTGSMSVPIVTSPGRSDFGPQLSLNYDSGAGNGPFGLGWSLSLPAITRKTEKGIPKYRDADESDVFILSGAEDLVPVLAEDGTISITSREGFQISRYRPRIEGLFARIERWTNDQGETHWRSITTENITTIYGKTDESQIRDPDNSSHVFSWLICGSYDDRGNAISYEYLRENSDGVTLSSVNERNRTDTSRSANRYIKRIKYCASTPRRENEDSDWLMEVVFDYGEHDVATPEPDATAGQEWQVRSDPVSTYRAGFEMRTYRLCRRVLMFHRFPELGETPCLVNSTDFEFEQTAIASFLTSVTQSGYVRRTDGTYLKKSMPPVDFTYTKAVIEQKVRELDAESAENLPSGLDGSNYQWVDLDGDGVAGILSEQATAWFYKRNLSPKNIVVENSVSHTVAKLAPVETVAVLPSFKGTGTQFLDLEGDGQPDRVQFDGPVPGFYERQGEGWALHRPFTSLPSINWNDPNLKFIDLTGDGRTDLLISEDNVFTWYPSLGEAGFDARERAFQPLDQEKGPRLVFTDVAQSIFLADLSGDGLTDIVRIRNGEICYWPNLGYGRFGVKVTMDNPPLFDRVDQFDQRRIRLADIDGSGVTDIIYLHDEGVRIYFNESGNRWSDAVPLSVFPQTDNLSSVTAIDLLGNGTACLVWSSPLPGHAARSLKYVDLMGGQKPHLMVSSRNNLGAETRLHYAPSTKFHLEDKYAGKPWITKLPFPVHVVERVETFDYISRNHFVTRYAYHHGYFDGPEREFRGFGMVEQWDTDTFNGFDQPATNIDAQWQVPPVHTKTWFHTGAYFEGAQISRHLAHEYFGAPQDETAFQVWARENLLDDTVLPVEVLTADEQRQACRALKGLMLRQEVYADDGSAKAGIPYTVAEQNFTIKRVQPKGNNRHAVFFTHQREAINFHYERNLNDPRINHTITLEFDDFGNMLKQVSIGYGRRQADAALPTQADREKQTTTLVTYTENRVTKAIDDVTRFSKDYRAPMPCETRTFELSGYVPTGPGGRFQSSDFVEPDPDVAEPGRMRHKFLVERAYEDRASGAQQRRPIELVRTLYRRNDLTALCPLAELESLALLGESYKLAFTPGLLATVYQRPRADGTLENLIPDPDAVLGSQAGNGGGYVKSQTLKSDGRFPADDPDDHWWIPTGRTFFRTESADDPAAELIEAKRHFFLTRRYRDPFGKDTLVSFDAHDLLMIETRDALGNRITAGERRADGTIDPTIRGNDYRVLQPVLVSDPNRNRTQVVFDALGMLVGTAEMGKPEENLGDSVQDFIADLDDDIRLYHLANPLNNPAHPLRNPTNPLQEPAAILRRATTRLIYDLFAYDRTRNQPEPQPAVIYTLVRKTHHADLAQNEVSRFQHSFSYSDGFGREIQKKVQAERGPLVDGGPDVERWVGSGWTIFNNKGKPVQRFEPFFSATHHFQFNARAGVSPILFYDPVERMMATLQPNHTYEKVLFDSWQQTTYDVNDTVAARNTQTGDPRTDPDIRDFTAGYFAHLPANPPWQTWHEERQGGLLGDLEQAAAVKAAAHADTPTTSYFDTLGRPFLTFSDNGSDPAQPGNRLLFAARVELDIEGNQRSVRDALKEGRDNAGNRVVDELGRVVMHYDYDMLGNRIHQLSMEAGARWMLNDVTGKALRAWDSRGHNFVTVYDDLRRPLEQYVRGTSPESDPRTTSRDILFEKIEYGEGQPNAETLNVRTRIFRHSDSAGVATNSALNPNSGVQEGYDFKGNLLRSTRRLARDYTAIPDWSLDPELEDETFTNSTRFDALNRAIQSIAPHSSLARARRNIIRHEFNEANLLERVHVWLDREAEPVALLDPQTDAPSSVGVSNINYDAKGQRIRIDYLNRASTFYEYDPSTFRLIHLLTSRHAPDFPRDCPQPPPNGWPGCQVQNLHYTYDPVGNITNIRDDAQQTIFFSNQRVEPSAEFTYDATYRLIEATGREHLGQIGADLIPYSHDDAPRVGVVSSGPGGGFQPNDGNTMGRYCENFVYDSAGNILEMVHRRSCPGVASWRRTFTYEEQSLVERGTKTSNCLTSTTIGVTNPTVEPIKHDAHGNMVRMPHLGGTDPDPNMHWDYRDRLRQTDLGGGGRAFYVYDATGRRVRKVWEKPGNLVEERIYLGLFEVFRRQQNSDFRERETLHVIDDKRRIALVETRTVDTTGNDPAPEQMIRYQFSNHLGSASLELDQRAQIISYEEYTPFGSTSYQAVPSATQTSKRYRYTAKERDEESGFYYHGARYYAPWLARWTSCDPMNLLDGPNLYRYSHNRPLVLIDPNGMQAGDPSKEKKKAPAKEQKKASGKELTPVDPEKAKKALEKKYGITIEKGDKEWSASDIEDLKWALEKLTKKEAEVLKGYRFLRWQDRESRKAADPDYKAEGEEEAGLHEADLTKNIFKISLYDKAFDKATTFQLTIDDKPVGDEVLVSRIGMLHEIGHAIAQADYRKAWNKYAPAETAYNDLIKKHNAASGKQRTDLAAQVKTSSTALDLLDKEVNDAGPQNNFTRAEREFESLAKGMTPVTEYAGTDASQGFAETFAMYKLNALGIEKKNSDLAKWFKSQGYLKLK